MIIKYLCVCERGSRSLARPRVELCCRYSPRGGPGEWLLYLAPSPKDTHNSWLVLISWDRAEQLSPCTRDSHQEPPLSWVNSDFPPDLSTNSLPGAVFTDRLSLKGSWGWSSLVLSRFCPVLLYGFSRKRTFSLLKWLVDSYKAVSEEPCHSHCRLADLFSFTLWNTNSISNQPEPLYSRDSSPQPRTIPKKN